MKPERQNILVVVVALVAIVVIAGRSPQASADDSREKQMKDAASQSAKAAKAFDGIMQVPDKAIPRELIAQAKAIAVFPQVIKVAFAAGGGGGRGVVSLHIGDTWGEPVFFRAGGGSVGPQIGASSTDFVLLLMDDASVEAFLEEMPDARVSLVERLCVAKAEQVHSVGESIEVRRNDEVEVIRHQAIGVASPSVSLDHVLEDLLESEPITDIGEKVGLADAA